MAITEAQAAASGFSWHGIDRFGIRYVAEAVHRGNRWRIVVLSDGGFWPGDGYVPEWVPSVPSFDTLRDAKLWCEFVALVDEVRAGES